MKKLLIALIIVVLDQLTKFFVNDSNLVLNEGAAFGILQGYNYLFVLIALIVVFFVFYYYKKVSNKEQIALMLLLGGTLGNLIDRVFLGFVRDFIDLKVWPVFNIADMANVIGVFLLIYYLYKK